MKVGILGEFTLRVHIIMINTIMEINSHLYMVCSQLFKIFIVKTINILYMRTKYVRLYNIGGYPPSKILYHNNPEPNNNIISLSIIVIVNQVRRDR